MEVASDNLTTFFLQALQRYCLWPVSALDGGRFPSLWRLSVGHTFRERGTDLGRRRRSFSSGDLVRFLVMDKYEELC